MDSIEQQLRASRDKMRARQDWRPGENVLQPLPVNDWGIYSPYRCGVTTSHIAQSVDEIIYDMMHGDSA